ncbi:Bestrophin, partial [Cooperia oncophora]
CFANTDEFVRVFRNFEHIADYFNERIACVPLTFLLGFFVSIIVRRWRDTFDNMGWIGEMCTNSRLSDTNDKPGMLNNSSENLALTLTNLLQGDEMENRQMRRTIIRYHVFIKQQVLVFSGDIVMRIRRRFPTMESLVNAGFLNAKELKELNEVDLAYNRYWTPLYWALGVSFKALEKEYFRNAMGKNLRTKSFRTNLAILCNFDWVPIPISYPQCFVVAKPLMLGCFQIELYFPFMTMLEFIFLVGWMKVAEGLLNPMGEDDDDFESSFVIDKNLATGLCIVDDEYGACPELTPDCFTDPEYNPVYTEDGGYGVLTGSAEQHSLLLRPPKKRWSSMFNHLQLEVHLTAKDLSERLIRSSLMLIISGPSLCFVNKASSF